MKNIKKSLHIITSILLGFSIFTTTFTTAYAGGDASDGHSHDDDEHEHAAKPKNTTLAKTQKSTEPKIVTAPALAPVVKNIQTNTQATTAPTPQTAPVAKRELFKQNSLLLNAKVAANPKQINYVFSKLDGLLTIKQTIIVGQNVQKGQVLGTVTTILNPMDAANQKNQIALLNGEIKQQQAILKRYQSIPELVATKNIDEARLKIQSLQQQIKVVQSPLQLSQTLVSPASGIVTQSVLNANKVINTSSELLQISPANTAALEIHAEYYLTDIRNNPSKDSQAFLLAGSEKIPLTYLGYVPLINSANKNSLTLRFKLSQNTINLILGQSLRIEYQPNKVVAVQSIAQ